MHTNNMSENEEQECNPNKTCKNMKHVHYGFTPKSWKEKLISEGKWTESKNTI
jgi:hypothetical protein